MTIVMADAVQEMPEEEREAYKDGSLMTILYADDTLLVGDQQEKLQAFLDAVAKVGLRYGLELH